MDLEQAPAKQKKEKLWTGLFIVMITISFVCGTSNQALNNAIPLYIDQYGGTTVFSGFLATVYAFAAGTGRLFGGQLTDRNGRRSTMLIGAFVFFAATLGPALITNVNFLVIWRIFQGGGFAFLATAAGTMVADILPKSRLSEGIGYYGLGQSLSTAVGPSIGIFLISLNNIKLTFLSIAIALLAALILGLGCNSPLIKTKESLKENKLDLTERNLIWRVFEKKAMMPFVIQVIVSLAFANYINFLSLYGTHAGFNNPGLFFTLAAVTMLLSRLVLSKYLDRYPAWIVFTFVYGTGIASFLIIIFANSDWVFYTAGLFFGLSFGIFVPFLHVICIALIPQGRWGAATATYYVGADIGLGLGGMFCGILINRFGFAISFAACAACMAVAFVISVITIKNDILQNNLYTDPHAQDESKEQ